MDEVTSKSSSDEDLDDDESVSSASSQSGKLENGSQALYGYEEDTELDEWSDYANEFSEDGDYTDDLN